MIVLASGSPRRKSLLEAAGVDFVVEPSQCEEVADEKATPKELVQDLACVKALDVAKKHNDDFVIGADTIVVINNRVLGKPKNREDARLMLKTLSGKKHSVFTGLAFAYHGEIKKQLSEATVEFNDLSDEEIENYLNTDEPYDKAGSYAIQGNGHRFVKSITGDFFTIVGLPVKMVLDELKTNKLI